MLKRPVLRYHGGKWKIAPWIVSHFLPHYIYVEPFGGGASVLLQKPRSKTEIYNDINADIVNIFRILRNPDTAQQLIEACVLTPFSRDEYASFTGVSDDPIDRARQYIAAGFMSMSTCVCNFQIKSGFRGKGYRDRVNQAWEWRTYPEQLANIVDRLRGVCIENRCAFELIAINDHPDAFFYCDPPYPKSTRTQFGAYKEEFTEEDHCRLSRQLHKAKGKVAISSYDSALYRDLYADWRKVSMKTQGDGGERTECLWLSYS